jgi:phosphopantetheine adenylyltransferase
MCGRIDRGDDVKMSTTGDLVFNVCEQEQLTALIRTARKKNGPRYNFAIDDPNEKKYTGNEIHSSKNTTNLSDHIIFIPSTHLWTMGNFYFSNGNL